MTKRTPPRIKSHWRTSQRTNSPVGYGEFCGVPFWYTLRPQGEYTVILLTSCCGAEIDAYGRCSCSATPRIAGEVFGDNPADRYRADYADQVNACSTTEEWAQWVGVAQPNNNDYENLVEAATVQSEFERFIANERKKSLNNTDLRDDELHLSTVNDGSVSVPDVKFHIRGGVRPPTTLVYNIRTKRFHAESDHAFYIGRVSRNKIVWDTMHNIGPDVPLFPLYGPDNSDYRESVDKQLLWAFRRVTQINSESNPL